MSHKSSARSRSARGVALIVVCVLVAVTAGCGTRWDDDQEASVAARYAGGGGAATAGGTGARSGATASAGAGGGTVTTAAGSGGSGGAGSASDGTAAGGGAAAASSSELPCAAPSDAPGVSDTTITIGTISSLTGPLPGIGTTALAAARAYVNYRNSTGGVCGRQLQLRDADDGTDGSRHRAAINELAPSVLGIAGGLGGGDYGSADAVTQQNLPVVSGAVSDEFRAAPTVFSINPSFEDLNSSIGKYRYLYDAGVRTAAVVYVGVAQGRSEMDGKQIPLMQAAGIRVVLWC
jgi:ABC-type branched-subunit amino acid transport system substrate-binding protein